jgi:hypothetical protein
MHGAKCVQEMKADTVRRLAPWWISGYACELAWFLCFAANTTLSLAAGALLLASGTFCFVEALFELERPPHARLGMSMRALASAGSAINAAWLSVATVIALVMLAPESGRAVALAAVLSAAIVDTGLYAVMRAGSVSYALTLVWAFIGVFEAHQHSPVIRTLTGAFSALFLAAAASAAVRRSRTRPEPDSGRLLDGHDAV